MSYGKSHPKLIFSPLAPRTQSCIVICRNSEKKNYEEFFFGAHYWNLDWIFKTINMTSLAIIHRQKESLGFKKLWKNFFCLWSLIKDKWEYFQSSNSFLFKEKYFIFFFHLEHVFRVFMSMYECIILYPSLFQWTQMWVLSLYINIDSSKGGNFKRESSVLDSKKFSPISVKSPFSSPKVCFCFILVF